MLCPTCPKRPTCKSACAELEKELARIEKPLREVLKAPKELERISDAIAAKEFLKNNLNWEEQYESEEEQRDILARNQMIQRSFEELTPRQNACVQLFYWDGLTYAQIAEELGISRQAVSKHLEASYTIIRKYLTEALRSGCISALYK